MAKVYVRAHSPQGMANVYRAGRAWAHGSVHEIEVVDGDEEPTVDVRDPATGAITKRPDPTKISKKALEALRKDARISIHDDPKAAQDREQENARLRARVAELEGQLAQGQPAPADAGDGGEGGSRKRK